MVSRLRPHLAHKAIEPWFAPSWSRAFRPAKLRPTMDSKLFFSTFFAIFLAELGDKTQLAVLAISSESQKHVRLTVLLASVLALSATSAIAVFGGDMLSRFVSPLWLKRVAGAAFLVMGVFYLWSSGKAE